MKTIFDFTKELEYLKNVLDNDKLANVDKLSILSIDGFKGHEYLKNTFENEVNIYLKKIVNKKPNSFFSRIFFPYVEVSPTSENIVTSDIVRKIKVVNLHIENKNIVKALNNLKSIEDYHKIFILSSEEIKKYIKFKNELYELK